MDPRECPCHYAQTFVHNIFFRSLSSVLGCSKFRTILQTERGYGQAMSLACPTQMAHVGLPRATSGGQEMNKERQQQIVRFELPWFSPVRAHSQRAVRPVTNPLPGPPLTMASHFCEKRDIAIIPDNRCPKRQRSSLSGEVAHGTAPRASRNETPMM
jgi:hypothetical protein